ncbi:hypothetical protein PTSG_10630 [Salpingoeca rosetta]|uniref:Uncharacterized protein n=1 Tax=Salpingoeca rosetta (strain ATCC 50818 / BSB-021) TaxID=946362 RepID=F2URX0_SALR5|nr:uncharacterized protein PTSG_10630 [Salpingoeca rosetta]EGD80375.1 hypothetical protein PTSG_10630 [Salpingoeca rosetta]|eukprot:XP_004988165.1 hypothetical protein PTSG_10630 [Salpingoeca rosetta]
MSDATNDVLLPSFTACADPSPADDEGDQERCLQARNAKRRVSEAPTAFTCVTNASRHSSDTSVFTKLPKLSLSGNDDSSQSQSPSRSQSYSQSTSMYGGSNDPAVLTQFVRTEQWMMAPLPESTPPSSPKHSSDNTRRNDDDRHDECGRRERNNNRREPTAVSAAVTSPGIAPPSYNQPAVTYESLRASLRRTGDHRDGDDDDDNGSDGMHVADAYDEPVDAACNNSPLHTHPAPPLPALPDMLLPTREQKSDGGHATAAPPSTAQQRRLVRSAATNDLSCLQATPTAAASVHMEGGEHAAIQHRIAAAEASESESSLASSSLSSLPPWSSIILAVPPLLQWQQQQQKEEEQQVHQQEQRDGWVTSAHTVVAGADDFEHDDDHVDGDSGGAGGGIRAGFEEQVQQTRRTLRFQPVSDKQGVQPPQPPRASAEASHASAGIIQADIVNDSSSNGAVHDSSSSPRQHQHQQPCQSLHHHSHGYSHDHDHDHNQQHRQHSRPIEHVIGERLAHVRPAVRANLSTLALAIQRHTATRTCSPATPTATGRQSTTTTTTPARKTPAVTNATSPPPPPHVQLSQFSPSPCNMRGTPATDNTSVSRVCAYAPSPNDIGGFGRTLSTPPTHNQRPTTLDPIAEDTPIDGRSLMHCKPKFAAFPDMRELMMQQDRPHAQFVPFRYRMQKLERQHARRGVPGVQTWCALFEKVYKWADGVASAMVAGHSDGISGATNLADEHVVTVENNENACEPEVLSGASEGVELGLNVHGGVSGNAQPRQRPAQPVAL